MVDYIPIEKAKATRRLRLILTSIPGPSWTEAAKAVLHVKRIPYALVAQQPVVTNEALQEWTGHSNAPIVVYDDDRPRAGWAETLFLAGRLAPDPPLIPTEADYPRKTWRLRDAGYRGAERTFARLARLGHLPPGVAPPVRDAAPRRHA